MATNPKKKRTSNVCDPVYCEKSILLVDSLTSAWMWSLPPALMQARPDQARSGQVRPGQARPPSQPCVCSKPRRRSMRLCTAALEAELCAHQVRVYFTLHGLAWQRSHTHGVLITRDHHTTGASSSFRAFVGRKQLCSNLVFSVQFFFVRVKYKTVLA